MVKSVSQKYRCEFAQIFQYACEHLEAIFAVEVREVDSIHHAYNLFSKLNLPNNGRIRPGRGYPKTGFLMKILAAIFLNGSCVAEEDMWRFLRTMKIYPGKKHFMFGEPRKLLTRDLVRLKYLMYQQVPGSDPPCYEFLWGPQAYIEISMEKILKYLIKINQISPVYFSLYDDSIKAMRGEAERAEAGSHAEPQSSANPSAHA
ncbi:Melanoma-associated antigen B3 [Fukomys damarensis]|uniref:Melanoma-associated antigen B3 n=1 Tax=Fukomys damarensis TaxID=885580 RepID=A0A091CUH7_FUKDA|nr:Melanoma-associated antigen B3 [Fukomys damarensis]